MAVGNGICFGTGPPAEWCRRVSNRSRVHRCWRYPWTGRGRLRCSRARTGSSAGNRNKQRRDKARRDGPSHDPVMPNYADRKSESNPASDRQAHKPK